LLICPEPLLDLLAESRELRQCPLAPLHANSLIDGFHFI
jgi:hypothetical protein